MQTMERFSELSGIRALYHGTRNNQTTAIEWPDVLEAGGNQGIFIDIFPLDDVADGVHLDEPITEIQAVMYYSMLTNTVQLKSILESFFELPIRDQIRVFDEFSASCADTSDLVNYFWFSYERPKTNRKREWYQDIIYMPFEDIQIPCPAGYHDILTCQYGNYMEPVMGGAA